MISQNGKINLSKTEIIVYNGFMVLMKYERG